MLNCRNRSGRGSSFRPNRAHLQLRPPTLNPGHSASTTRRYWLLVAALTLANPLLHKTISDLCDWARARWGFSLYDRTALIAIPVVSALAISPMLARRAHLLLRPLTLASVLLLSAMTLAAQRWLLVTNIELIHFPQFALPAAVLLAAGLSGESAYLVATAAGIVDETYQHLVIYAGRQDTYLDFNDMILNAIGAAWAVVLLADILRPNDSRPRPNGVDDARLIRWLQWPRGLGAVLLALPLALWMDPPQFSPLLRPSIGGGTLYRVLSATEGLIAGTLLWGMVVLVTRGGSATQHAPSRGGIDSLRPLLLLLLAILSGCAAFRPLRGRAQPPDPPPFILTFWCGPPLAEFDDARAAEIAAAGFTVVGPPCEGGTDRERNRRALDVAARHGLEMWIADPRVNQYASLQPNWESRVAAAAADYRDHAAFAGYFVMDEPSAEEFEDLAPVVAQLHAADADDPAYVNLLPDYVTPKGLGTDDYREYVERFISTVGPRLLSYDYYPFGATKDRPTFFTNLATMRELAQRHHLPFMVIVLAMPHGPYRDPTEAELSWQVFHSLAFGARGISYFAYWTPVNVPSADDMKFRYGLIENGKPTLHYFQVMRLNRTVRAIAQQLASFRSVTVGDSLGEVAAPLPIGPIAAIEGAPVTAGFFADDTGQLAVLLVNRDYRYGAVITLRLRPGERRPQRLDVETNSWVEGDNAVLSLPPGGAQLVRWPPRR